MPSTSVGNRYAAAVWKFASLLHILPAAGTNSHVHLMRILAQHCAHGGAGRRYSLNLERVSPCHSSCTSPYTRFGNNLRERNDNWQPVCTPLLPAQCTPQSRSNDSLVSLTSTVFCGFCRVPREKFFIFNYGLAADENSDELYPILYLH